MVESLLDVLLANRAARRNQASRRGVEGNQSLPVQTSVGLAGDPIVARSPTLQFLLQNNPELFGIKPAPSTRKQPAKKKKEPFKSEFLNARERGGPER